MVHNSIAQGHLGRPSVTELHGSHAASCLASQAGAQATSPMEGMVITTSRLGLWPEGPRTDRYGHAEYEFSYRVHRRNVTRRKSVTYPKAPFRGARAVGTGRLPAVTPRPMPLPKRHRAELRHHARDARRRVSHPRGRQPSCSAGLHCLHAAREVVMLQGTGGASGAPSLTVPALSGYH